MLFLQPAQISRRALTLLNSPKPGMNSVSYSFSRSHFLSSTWEDWLGPTKDTLPLSTWLSGRSRWLRRHATQFLQIVTGKPLILDLAACHQSTTARSKIGQKTRNRSLKPQTRPPPKPSYFDFQMPGPRDKAWGAIADKITAHWAE